MKRNFLVRALVSCAMVLIQGAQVRSQVPTWIAAKEIPSIYALGTCYSASEAWVVDRVDGFDRLQRTTDSGKTWTTLQPPIGVDAQDWRPRFLKQSDGSYLVFTHDLSWRSADGDKWIVVDIVKDDPKLKCFSQQVLFSMSGKDLQILPFPLFTVGEGGKCGPPVYNVSASTNIDSGRLLVVHETIFADCPEDIASRMAVVVKENGAMRVAKSWDYSATYSYRFEPDFICYVNPSELWVSSDRMGGIYKSNDGGSEWSKRVISGSRLGSDIF